MSFAVNVLIAAAVISFTSWLSGRLPVLAGFIVAMPMATLLVLPMSYVQHGDPDKALVLARSIFLAIPVTLLFFVPFLLAERLGIGFWQSYGLGCVILPAGYFAHRFVTGLFV